MTLTSILRGRVLALAAALLLPLLAAPLAARAASSALWIADSGGKQVVEYLPSELESSHTPTPLTIPIGTDPWGVCFDKSHNLWVTDDNEEILEFKAADLKNLPAVPTPAVTITSNSFVDLVGCAFDKHGMLWIADLDADAAYGISPQQQKNGGKLTPAIVITDSAEMAGANPGFLTFDKTGNLWIDGRNDEELFKFSAAQLTSSGDKTAKVILGGGGSLHDPGQIAFDGKGNLWVTSYSAHTVVMFPKRRLQKSNDKPPAVTLSSMELAGPWGLGFRGGHLWVLNYSDGNAEEFIPSQLKHDGAPTPKTLLTDAANHNSWAMTFGPAFGTLP